MWVKTTGQIECDATGCGARFGLAEEQQQPQAVVIQAARIHGWHCYRGPSITDNELDLHVCARCVGRPEPAPKAKPLDDDVPMISTTGDLLVASD